MKSSIAVLIAAITLFAASAGAKAETAPAANPEGLVVIDSANTMAETEKRLTAALDAAGLKIAARIDHEANAKSVGLELAPTVLFIFGNPKAGTLLMQKQRTAGIDLPLKILMWDDNGKIKVAYNDPAYIARRHGIDPSLPVLSQITMAMQKFATAAVSH